MTADRLPVFVDAIGVAAPGLSSWSEARLVLGGERPYMRTELSSYQPQMLPANERRRAGVAVKLAFRAAEDAMGQSSILPHELATVFASSDADTDVIDRICSVLAEPKRLVSPTDFHNSVHNAAAGYWSIAAQCAKSSVSLSSWDQSFAAGLLEAIALVEEGDDVLLVAYDMPPPVPLLARRTIGSAFSTALVLTSKRTATPRARLVVTMQLGQPDTLSDPGLEALRLGNPAGRALPMLRALALGQPCEVGLPAVGDRVLKVGIAKA